MTKMPSYVVESPNFEPYKPKKQYNLYPSLLRISLSIFAYILIFHVLDVSPWSIFNDTKFLLFISNALIIIIAADYGAFADKEKSDFYGEYTAAMRSGCGVSLAEQIKNLEKQEKAVEALDIPQFLVKEEEEVPEKAVHVASKNQPRNIAVEKHEPTTEKDTRVIPVKEETCNSRKLVNPKTYGRSISDKARTERRHQAIKHRTKSYDQSKSDCSKRLAVRKAEEAEEATKKWENVKEESEFSEMSNEELNRRVEDFIQRFNTDIKRRSFV